MTQCYSKPEFNYSLLRKFTTLCTLSDETEKGIDRLLKLKTHTFCLGMTIEQHLRLETALTVC